MKLEQWVLFIDMLGFSEYNNSVVDDESAEDLLAFMNKNVSIFHKQSQSNDFVFCPYTGLKFDDFYDVKSAFISDSLIVTYKPKEVNINVFEFEAVKEFIKDGKSKDEAQKYYIDFVSGIALTILLDRLYQLKLHCMYLKGIFLRGGISNKFCDISGTFAVGKGLSEAHFIESRLAVDPIICLSSGLIGNNQLLDILIRTQLSSKVWILLEKQYTKGEHVKEEYIDKLYFFDYLAYSISLLSKVPLKRLSNSLIFILKHKECLEEKIRHIIKNKKTINKSVSDKYIWLFEYHNFSIDHFLSDSYMFSEDKELDKEIKESLLDFRVDDELLKELY